MNIMTIATIVLHVNLLLSGAGMLKPDMTGPGKDHIISRNENSRRNAQLQVSAITCEYQHDPIGIDATAPRLGWELIAKVNQRGLVQSAYQIQVAASRQDLLKNKADMWDSGKIDSIQSNNISYKGKPLRSSARYYWRVRVWDNHGKVSGWSEPGLWEMGLLHRSDWEGHWNICA